MAPKVKAPKQVENTQLGPQAREGEEVFGVAHIYASFNDTFVVCRKKIRGYSNSGPFSSSKLNTT